MQNAELNMFFAQCSPPAGTLFCYKTPQKPMRKQKQSSIAGEQSAKTRVSAHASKGIAPPHAGGRCDGCQQQQQQQQQQQTTTTTVAAAVTTSNSNSNDYIIKRNSKNNQSESKSTSPNPDCARRAIGNKAVSDDNPILC